MENILNKEQTTTEAVVKEPIKKMSNKELNNSLLLDTILKITKGLQLCNVILDFNNSFEDLDITISSDEYKNTQDDIFNLINKLGQLVDKFKNYYMEANNGLNNQQETRDTNIQES